MKKEGNINTPFTDEEIRVLKELAKEQMLYKEIDRINKKQKKWGVFK